MKTKTVSSRLALLAITITAALVSQPAFGSTITPHQIVITENSSTTLMATFDASPLTVTPTPGSPDNWSFSLPGGFLSLGQPAWTEPGSSLVNYVDFTLNTVAIVHSDILPNSIFSTNGDGVSVQVGTDLLDGTAVFATFHDRGDTAAVPDTGTTGSLFGLSLMGLAFLRRKLC
jgi:VPDSG-CTERM motif